MTHSWKLFLTLFLTYAFLANPYLTTNDAPRFSMAASLTDQGSLEISDAMQKYFPHEPGTEGWAVRDFALIDGKYYSDKAPLGSFLAVPFYFLASRMSTSRPFIIWFVTLFTAGLFTALTGVFVYHLGLHFLAGERMALFMGLGYGLCSMALFYGQILFSAGITAFFVTAGFMLLLKERLGLGGRYAPMLAGGCLALVIISDFYAGIASLSLLGYAAVGRKNFGRVLISFSFGLCLLLAYNYILLGNPTDTSYHHSFYSKTLHGRGFYGMILPNARGLVRLGELLFGFPFSNILLKLGIKPAFNQPPFEKWGFFMTCLPVVFSIICFRRFLTFRREAITVAVIFAGFIFLQMSLGWFDAYSARFFMPVLPLLFLPLATLPVASPGIRNLFFFTLGISLAINLLGADAFMPAVKSLASHGRQNLLGYYLFAHGYETGFFTLLALPAMACVVWLVPTRKTTPIRTEPTS